jgi:hypothetical protein
MHVQCQCNDLYNNPFKIGLKHISWRISSVQIRASREHSMYMYEEPVYGPPDSNNHRPAIDPHSDAYSSNCHRAL